MEKIGSGLSGTPEGLAVDAQGQVYITDYLNGAVQVFSNEGEFLWAWGSGGHEDGQLAQPTSIALDEAGRIYIVNQADNSVTVFQLP
jgi:DNA-binding beta-propeller fold protein YncE